MKNNRRSDDLRPSRPKQIKRHKKTDTKNEVGLSEDVRVVHSEEPNPHDG